ncbi:proton myo-inositol cotransporter-like isoform X2 [Anneissia japonica]|uniref:proton myo-inositol cotransporter-like isoform X2 n=1 Tax=Anneissia japonica TaxID=1529436 RepID=UPI00142589DB|nr:proton myo-inositol cotransporter-like isoform X2 [Anneissia japonica]
MSDLGRFSSRERLINANARSIKIRPPYNRLYVAVLACVAGLGGFLFGYDTGVVSGAMILLKDDFELSILWQELIVSVTIGAAAISALIGGVLNDRFGRRPVIITSSIVFSCGSLVLGFAQDKQTLLIGRIIVGVGIGLASMTVPMYIAEASPSHVRGRLVTVNNLFITGGQLVASIVDGLFSENADNGWRYMLGLAAVPAILQLIGFLFLHESPRWLVIHGQYQDAKGVLGKIYGENNYGDEFESIRTSVEEIKKAEHGGKKHLLKNIFKDPRVRQALIVGCGLQMFQQLAGINTVMYYSATIIHMAGIQATSLVIWLAAAVASVNFIFTVFGLLLVDRLGRRKLSIISMAGVVFAHLFLGASFQLASMDSPPVDIINNNTICHYSTCDGCILNSQCGFCYEELNNTIFDGACILGTQKQNLSSCDSDWAFDYCPSAFAFLAVVGMVLYLMFFAPGMGTMPWTVNSEIYPQWARSTCNSFSTFTNWMFNLLISMTFLSLTQAITRQGTFYLYAGISTLGLIFIITLLPETKGKRLEDIQQLFDHPCVLCASEDDTPDVRYVRVTPHRDADGSDDDGRISVVKHRPYSSQYGTLH